MGICEQLGPASGGRPWLPSTRALGTEASSGICHEGLAWHRRAPSDPHPRLAALSLGQALGT
eukprot:4273663-Pyramimonas_sp.AAC.1